MSEGELENFLSPGPKLIPVVSHQVALCDKAIPRFMYFGSNPHRLGFETPFRLPELRLELSNSSLPSIEDRQFQLPRWTGHALSVRFLLRVDSELDAADISIRLRDTQASDERADLTGCRGQVKPLIDGQGFESLLRKITGRQLGKFIVDLPRSIVAPRSHQAVEFLPVSANRGRGLGDV